MSTKQTWPQVVLAWRNRMKLTQRAAADAIGVDPMTISRWERGAHEPEPLVREAVMGRMDIARSKRGFARLIAADVRQTKNKPPPGAVMSRLVAARVAGHGRSIPIEPQET